MAILGVWLLCALVQLDAAELDAIRAWLSSPLAATLLLLTIATLAWHAILGLQVVIEDYVGAKGVRVATLIAMKFAFVLAAVAGGIAVLRLALGVPG